MSLDFMKPELWDGLVIGVTFVGIALAILRLMNDYAFFQRKQQRIASHQEHQPSELDTDHVSQTDHR